MSRGNPAPPDEIRTMFDRIARVYDPMNALISGFQEPRWRRRAVQAARLGPGMRAIDVACGTGRVAIDVHRQVAPGGTVVGIDVAPAMIEQARSRAAGRSGLEFVVGDALDLPVDDGTFDAATIAFGMRNLADYRRGFEELRRVVRPGGRVICLEIARPASHLGRLLARWFDHAVPFLGRIAGRGDAYAYLVRSTRTYPGPARIAEIMAEAGLTDVCWRPLSAGLVTIHVGVRPVAAEPAPPSAPARSPAAAPAS